MTSTLSSSVGPVIYGTNSLASTFVSARIYPSGKFAHINKHSSLSSLLIRPNNENSFIVYKLSPTKKQFSFYQGMCITESPKSDGTEAMSNNEETG